MKKKLRVCLFAVFAAFALAGNPNVAKASYPLGSDDAFEAAGNLWYFINEWCYPQSFDPYAYENCRQYMLADVTQWLYMMWWQSIQLGDWDAAGFFQQVRNIMLWS